MAPFHHGPRRRLCRTSMMNEVRRKPGYKFEKARERKNGAKEASFIFLFCRTATWTMTKKKLWIGGTSGLTRTYLNVFDESWILLGCETQRPSWIPSSCTFVSCDLTQSLDVRKLMDEYGCHNVTHVVVSIRPKLVTPMTHSQAMMYKQRLLGGLHFLLQALDVQQLIHISSVAAVDHLQGQHLINEQQDPIESSRDLQLPYDRFKRACEEVIPEIGASSYTNLRLGAIFSDDPGCIQCNALGLQAYLSAYIQDPIDCNSSKNVAHLIRMILQENSPQLQPVYYYTRPLGYTQPIPYGDYLIDYRRAHDIRISVWIPYWMLTFFTTLFHGLATTWIGDYVPYLQSIDYLLQVSMAEHSFDLSLVQRDFPQLLEMEESIEDCFRRRRRILKQQQSV